MPPCRRSDSVRGRQEARLAALPRCRHGRLYAAESGAYSHLECRECLPGGQTVTEWVAAHPGGAEPVEVAEALGVSRQAVAQSESRAVAKLRKAVT